MRKLLWILTFLAGLLAGAVLLLGVLGSSGAPQQAAAAAIAAALVVIPYCMARAIDALERNDPVQAPAKES